MWAPSARVHNRSLGPTPEGTFRLKPPLATTAHRARLCGQVSAVNQENYPEALEECYVINAPWAFTAIYAFIKPFLNENTLKKIKVRAHVHTGWVRSVALALLCREFRREVRIRQGQLARSSVGQAAQCWLGA